MSTHLEKFYLSDISDLSFSDTFYEYLDENLLIDKFNGYINGYRFFSLRNWVDVDIDKLEMKSSYFTLLSFVAKNYEQVLVFLNSSHVSIFKRVKEYIDYSLKFSIDHIVQKYGKECSQTEKNKQRLIKLIDYFKHPSSLDDYKSIFDYAEHVLSIFKCTIQLKGQKFNYGKYITTKIDEIAGKTVVELKKLVADNELTLDDIYKYRKFQNYYGSLDFLFDLYTQYYNYSLDKIYDIIGNTISGETDLTKYAAAWFNQSDATFAPMAQLCAMAIGDNLLSLINELVVVDHCAGKNYFNLHFIDCAYDFGSHLLSNRYFSELNQSQKDQVLRLYYISIFDANNISKEIARKQLSHDIYSIYDIFAGYKENIPNLLRTVFIHSCLSGSDFDIIKDFFDDYKDSDAITLYLSAYYTKALRNYTPIFEGMEHTPILVDLYKAIEVLCCEFLQELKITQLQFNGKVLTYDRDNKYSFDNDDKWIHYITLGNINNVINKINSFDGKVILNGVDISKRIVNKYNNADIFTKENNYLLKFIQRFFEHYGKKFGLPQLNNLETLSNSEILFTLFDIWINKCRNGNLHKSNITDKDYIEYQFDFTNLVFVQLVMWFYILKGKHR